MPNGTVVPERQLQIQESGSKPAAPFEKGKILNFYKFYDSNCSDWCCGFWCLPCFLGNNAESKYLPARSYWQDCCLSYCLGYCVGSCLVNQGQRKELEPHNVVAQDNVGACICAPCVACETARALEYLDKINAPVPQTGLTSAPLISTQPGGV